METRKAGDLYSGDWIDLEGDPFADPAGDDPLYASREVRVRTLRLDGDKAVVGLEDEDREIRVPRDHPIRFRSHGFEDLPARAVVRPRRMLLVDWRRRRIVEGTTVLLVDADGVPNGVETISSMRDPAARIGRWLDEAVRLGIDVEDLRDPSGHPGLDVPATLDGRGGSGPAP